MLYRTFKKGESKKVKLLPIVVKGQSKRERERDGHTERQKNRQSVRNTNRKIHRQKDRQKVGNTDRKIYRQK